MPETFETTWRRARLLFPQVPALVVRDWVQEAYTRLCERKPWSWLQQEGVLSTLAPRTVAVTAVQGSATLVSVGLFVAGDAGRQVRVGSTLPIYTVIEVVDLNTVTLDTPWAAVDGPYDATILDAYVTLPATFGAFLSVVDPYNQLPIRWVDNRDRLNQIDPTRTAQDASPLSLVAATPSPALATLGQPRFAWYPIPTLARQYPYVALQRPAPLADDTVLPGPLGDRSDLLKLGAQAAAAEWPGTVDHPNPYFNLGLADRLSTRWEAEVNRLMLRDDDRAPEQYVQYPVGDGPGSTASRLRATDATTFDYL